MIRAFKGNYPIGAKVDFDALVESPIDFYAHCVTDFGIKLGFWEKVVFSPIIGDTDHILFRSCSIYDLQADISFTWWVWKINEEARYVGKLEGEYTKAEFGAVFPPPDIVHRMKTGEYIGSYPGY